MKLVEAILVLNVVALSITVVYSKFNLEKIFESIVHPTSKSSNKANVKFSFINCGPNTDLLIVKSLSISPEPLKLPGEAFFNFFICYLFFELG
jgi:hypothetical protein